MLRTLKTVSLTAALSLLCLSADAVPPSILEPASIDPADYWGDIDLQQARQSVSTSLAAPDTLYTLCPVGSKSFSPSFGGSDVWGWADSEGREYAIMGIENGIVFVDAETQAQVGFVSGPNAGPAPARVDAGRRPCGRHMKASGIESFFFATYSFSASLIAGSRAGC